MVCSLCSNDDSMYRWLKHAGACCFIGAWRSCRRRRLHNCWGRPWWEQQWCTRTHTHMHIHINTHTHTHTCTHAQHIYTSVFTHTIYDKRSLRSLVVKPAAMIVHSRFIKLCRESTLSSHFYPYGRASPVTWLQCCEVNSYSCYLRCLALPALGESEQCVNAAQTFFNSSKEVSTVQQLRLAIAKCIHCKCIASM